MGWGTNFCSVYLGHMTVCIRALKRVCGGRTGLMVRASDFGSGDPGSILGRAGVFVSLSKRHLLPKKYW